MAKSFLGSLFRRKSPRPVLDVSVAGSSLDGVVAITGTTTHGRDAVERLAHRHGLGAEGFLELAVQLHPEPSNAVDPNAIAVVAEGERIGYMPGYSHQVLDIPVGTALTVPLQLFTLQQGDRLISKGYVWVGRRTPTWEHSATRRPPMTGKEKANASHAGTTARVRADRAAGGARADEVAAGTVEGIYFLEAVEPIKELKRQGKLEEALRLCYIAIEGAEGATRRDGYGAPAPWYTEQAAIVHRKLKQRDEEIAVLQRYVAWLAPELREGNRIAERLAKLVG